MISGYVRFFTNPFFGSNLGHGSPPGLFAISIWPDYSQKVNLFQTGGDSRGAFAFSLPVSACLSFLGVAGKRDLVFIAIGEHHMGLAWDLPVILFWKQITPKIS
jgi:hypothetical protein